jgi:hypothetical protein
MLLEGRKKAARSHAGGMMLEVVEAQGRRFRLKREPMVKVKQVDLPILGPDSFKDLARDLATAYVINLGCQCCGRQT